MNSVNILLSCFVLYLATQYSEACSCIAISPEDKVCAADLTIMGTVKSKQFIPPNKRQIRYKIEVKEVLSGSSNQKEVFVTTSDSSASCGVDLVEGKLYVLSMFGNGHKFNMNLCQSWKMELTESNDADIRDVIANSGC